MGVTDKQTAGNAKFMAAAVRYVRNHVLSAAPTASAPVEAGGGEARVGSLPNLPEGWTYVRYADGVIRVQHPPGMVGEPYGLAAPRTAPAGGAGEALAALERIVTRAKLYIGGNPTCEDAEADAQWLAGGFAEIKMLAEAALATPARHTDNDVAQ